MAPFKILSGGGWGGGGAKKQLCREGGAVNMTQGSHRIPVQACGDRARKLLPNSQRSHVARGGREPGGQGGTATWKRLDANHLAWAECGLPGEEEKEPSWEGGHGGRVDGGLELGVARLEAPTFQTTAAQMPSQPWPGPSNPLTSFPAPFPCGPPSACHVDGLL